MQARPCFVHVGTHKTGTTALQAFLSDNEDVLAASGVLYPKCGRLPGYPGHHNVAMEISGDERFDRALGTFDELVRELQNSSLPAACISSEAFQFSHAHPDQLTRLRDGILSAGYHPKVVVYLRSQAEYVESMYCTLVFHGYALPFSHFLREVLNRGYIRYGNARSYQFDYDLLLDSYAAVFGDSSVIVRDYRWNPDPGALIRDFLETIGLRPDAAAAARAPARHENPRRTLCGVMHKLLANARVAAPSLETLDFLNRSERILLETGHQPGFRPLLAQDVIALASRFDAGNRRVNTRRHTRIEAVPATFVEERRALEDDPARQEEQALLRSVERDLSLLTTD